MREMPEVIWLTPLGGLSDDSEAHASKRGDDFQSYTRTDIVDDLTEQLEAAELDISLGEDEHTRRCDEIADLTKQLSDLREAADAMLHARPDAMLSYLQTADRLREALAALPQEKSDG